MIDKVQSSIRNSLGQHANVGGRARTCWCLTVAMSCADQDGGVLGNVRGLSGTDSFWWWSNKFDLIVWSMSRWWFVLFDVWNRQGCFKVVSIGVSSSWICSFQVYLTTRGLNSISRDYKSFHKNNDRRCSWMRRSTTLFSKRSRKVQDWWHSVTIWDTSSSSSTVKAIATRLGLPEVRHMETKFLWVQKVLRHFSVQFARPPCRRESLADLSTKTMTMREIKANQLEGSSHRPRHSHFQVRPWTYLRTIFGDSLRPPSCSWLFLEVSGLFSSFVRPYLDRPSCTSSSSTLTPVPACSWLSFVSSLLLLQGAFRPSFGTWVVTAFLRPRNFRTCHTPLPSQLPTTKVIGCTLIGNISTILVRTSLFMASLSKAYFFWINSGIGPLLAFNSARSLSYSVGCSVIHRTF